MNFCTSCNNSTFSAQNFCGTSRRAQNFEFALSRHAVLVCLFILSVLVIMLPVIFVPAVFAALAVMILRVTYFNTQVKE